MDRWNHADPIPPQSQKGQSPGMVTSCDKRKHSCVKGGVSTSQGCHEVQLRWHLCVPSSGTGTEGGLRDEYRCTALLSATLPRYRRAVPGSLHEAFQAYRKLNSATSNFTTRA